MPIDAERALAAALLARLRADAALAADLQGRVYDEPPAQPTYPYLVLGKVESRPFGGGDGEGADGAALSEGVEATLVLTCVSRFGGAEEAKRVNAGVHACLHGVQVALTDWRLVNLRVAFHDVIRAADWRSTYGVTRLRAVAEPNIGA